MDGDDEPTGDVMTPLDATLDRIGMGYYQWSLLALCGFGWLADNMWMEGVAIALPRVQDHFNMTGQQVGVLSSFFFCGMMFGAVVWGNCSDVLGRRVAFNATLVLSSLFGLVVSISPSFTVLAASLLLLGSAVGGSIPTDGTLFVENLPKRKHWLLTFLSVFFSLGALLTAIVAVIVIPGHSCPEAAPGSSERPPCDVALQNAGWRYMFGGLTLITAAMFVGRIFLFHLHESPKYLVHTGRPEDAALVLRAISKVNGTPLNITVEDVRDTLTESPTTYDGEPLRTRSESQSSRGSRSLGSNDKFSRLDTLRNGLTAWYRLSSASLVPTWRRTTVLMWGYTLFNLFFPKLVELRLGTHQEGGSVSQALWNVVIYTLGGTPGSLIGAWMVETRLGKRKSLAISTGLTGIFCLLFSVTPSNAGVMITSVGVSLTSTIMWAILYGMTPQMFVTEVRGTACGNASALNRVAGIITPPLGGFLLDLDVSFPTYTSALAFIVATVFALALPYESAADLEASEPSRGSAYSLLH
ncbi:MFS general substrate transporter [Clavulina sp. PMI_390]|nr:MFS general substrate transporter [Clavulina sp. PMI_390]